MVKHPNPTNLGPGGGQGGVTNRARTSVPHWHGAGRHRCRQRVHVRLHTIHHTHPLPTHTTILVLVKSSTCGCGTTRTMARHGTRACVRHGLRHKPTPAPHRLLQSTAPSCAFHSLRCVGACKAIHQTLARPCPHKRCVLLSAGDLFLALLMHRRGRRMSAFWLACRGTMVWRGASRMVCLGP